MLDHCPDQHRLPLVRSKAVNSVTTQLRQDRIDKALRPVLRSGGTQPHDNRCWQSLP